MTPFSFAELAQQSIPVPEGLPVSLPISSEPQPVPDASQLKLTGRNAGCPCAACSHETQFADVAGIAVAACPQCLGFLSQRRDFSKIIERVRKAYRGPVQIRPLDQAQLRMSRKCPTCDKTFETHAYAGPGTTVIDSCPQCETVWLDGGELERIEQAPGRR